MEKGSCIEEILQFWPYRCDNSLVFCAKQNSNSPQDAESKDLGTGASGQIIQNGDVIWMGECMGDDGSFAFAEVLSEDLSRRRSIGDSMVLALGRLNPIPGNIVLGTRENFFGNGIWNDKLVAEFFKDVQATDLA